MHLWIVQLHFQILQSGNTLWIRQFKLLSSIAKNNNFEHPIFLTFELGNQELFRSLNLKSFGQLHGEILYFSYDT